MIKTQHIFLCQQIPATSAICDPSHRPSSVKLVYKLASRSANTRSDSPTGGHMTNKMKMKGWLMVRSDLYGPFNSLLRTFIIFALPPDWFVLWHPLIVSFIYLYFLVHLFIAVFKARERQWSHEHLCPFRQTNFTTHDVRSGEKKNNKAS